MELSDISFLPVLPRSQDLSHYAEKQVATSAIASVHGVGLRSGPLRLQHALLLPDVLGLKIGREISAAEAGAQQNLDIHIKRVK